MNPFPIDTIISRNRHPLEPNSTQEPSTQEPIFNDFLKDLASLSNNNQDLKKRTYLLPGAELRLLAGGLRLNVLAHELLGAVNTVHTILRKKNTEKLTKDPLFCDRTVKLKKKFENIFEKCTNVVIAENEFNGEENILKEIEDITLALQEFSDIANGDASIIWSIFDENKYVISLLISAANAIINLLRHFCPNEIITTEITEWVNIGASVILMLIFGIAIYRCKAEYGQKFFIQNREKLQSHIKRLAIIAKDYASALAPQNVGQDSPSNHLLPTARGGPSIIIQNLENPRTYPLLPQIAGKNVSSNSLLFTAQSGPSRKSTF